MDITNSPPEYPIHESPPEYPGNDRFFINNSLRNYIIRKGVQIILLENGELYLQGNGMIFERDKITLIPENERILVSCNVSNIEAYSYYNYNSSPKDKFRIYGDDGSLILKAGKDSCILI